MNITPKLTEGKITVRKYINKRISESHIKLVSFIKNVRLFYLC